VKLILASKSPRRKRILEKMGFEFEIEPSNADESSIMANGMQPEKLVMALAELKAESVAKGHSNEVILGADTIVYHEGRVIGKAKSEEEAMSLLKSLLGKEHSVYTGICAINIATGQKKTDFVISKVKLKDIGEEELKNYVESGFYKGKAGAYNIDDPEFQSFIERIDGCAFNIIGLGFAKGLEVLKSVGMEPKKE
jgi:septum formation protein